MRRGLIQCESRRRFDRAVDWIKVRPDSRQVAESSLSSALARADCRSKAGSVTEGDSKVRVAKGLQFRGRVAEAEALYREVLRDEPGDAEALEGLGVLVFQQGRIAEAAELFARGVAICPESARFHANLGEALRSTDRLDQALTHLRRATELDPSLPHAWNSLALLAQSQGRYADSEASCREAIRLSPRLTAAYINLGNALSALEPAGRSRRRATRGPGHRAPQLRCPHEPGCGALRFEGRSAPERGRITLPSRRRTGTAGFARPSNPRKHSPSARTA